MMLYPFGVLNDYEKHIILVHLPELYYKTLNMKFMYINTSIYVKVVIEKGKSILKLFHVIHMGHIFSGGRA